MNRKLVAKESLTEALAIFEQLGAPAWAERAESEIRRLGLRHRPPDELTASERRIAELAAAGLTNRQVAETAFVSPKTVEANLARSTESSGSGRGLSSARASQPKQGRAKPNRRETPDVSVLPTH